MNEFWKRSHLKNLLVVILISVIALMLIDGAWRNLEFVRDLIKEFVIVLIAAFLVSAYFEFYLRKEISEEFNKILEMKEEFGRAGIIKYYSSYRDVDLRSYFQPSVKSIDIYVTYGNTFFKGIEDKLEQFCRRPDAHLSIFLLSKDNPFIIGLGNLWGRHNADYDVEGIKRNIDSTINLLIKLVERLAEQGNLNAKIKISLLKRHPVFYSFQRFDDEIIYVPSKIIEPKSFVPLSFLCRKTTHSEGIYNKCMEEIKNIIQDQNCLEIIFEH